MRAAWLFVLGCAAKSPDAMRVDVSNVRTPTLRAASEDALVECVTEGASSWDQLNQALRMVAVGHEPGPVAFGNCVVAISPQRRTVRLDIADASGALVALTLAPDRAAALATASSRVAEAVPKVQEALSENVTIAIISSLRDLYRDNAEFSTTWETFTRDLREFLKLAQKEGISDPKTAKHRMGELRETLTRTDCDPCFAPGKVRNALQALSQ